jgi:hypothetical protein
MTISRRTFVKSVAGAGLATVAAPYVARAQADVMRLGLLTVI